jgi:hypothetical protein
MSKSKQAFLFSAERLGEQGLYMWTLTFRELLALKDTRKRWNYLLTLMKRRWLELCGLRVFEMHKEHGLHVHLITNRRIYVNEVRRLAKKAGWGRVNVKRVPPERAAYLAKYLGKARPEAMHGWRLWGAFGRWDWSRVGDVTTESLLTETWRECSVKYGWTGKENFFWRQEVVNSQYRQRLCE